MKNLISEATNLLKKLAPSRGSKNRVIDMRFVKKVNDSIRSVILSDKKKFTDELRKNIKKMKRVQRTINILNVPAKSIKKIKYNQAKKSGRKNKPRNFKAVDIIKNPQKLIKNKVERVKVNNELNTRPDIDVNMNVNFGDNYKYSGPVTLTYEWTEEDNKNNKTLNRRQEETYDVDNKTYEELVEYARIRFEKYTELFADYIMSGSQNTTVSGGRVNLNYDDIIFEDEPVREVKYCKLSYDLECYKDTIKENCVTHYLTEKYGKTKRYIKAIKSIKDKKDWTVKTLLEFLKSNNITYTCYLSNMRKYKCHNGSKEKQFIFIISNNHLYPVTNQEVKKLKEFKKDKLIIDHIEYKPKLKEFITENREKLVFSRYNILQGKKPIFERVYCKTNKTLYVTNEIDKKAYDLFSKVFGYFPIKFKFKCYSFLMHVAENNKLFSTYDNFINNETPLIPSYDQTYKVDDDDDEYLNEEVYKPDDNQPLNYLTTIDKNKSHMCALFNLDKLPIIGPNTFTYSVVMNHNKIMDMRKRKKLNLNLFYHIKEIYNRSPLFIQAGWCSGYRLAEFLEEFDNKKLGKKTLRFEVDYIKKPVLVDNPFKEVINKCKDIDMKTLNTAVHRFIGVCQIKKKSCTKLHKNYLGVCSSEAECIELLKAGLEDAQKYAKKNNPKITPEELEKVKENFYKRNGYEDMTDPTDPISYYARYCMTENNKLSKSLLPIAYYVMDYASCEVYRKLNELRALDDNVEIYKIKTDSITFKSNVIKMSDLKLNNDSNALGGWGIEIPKIQVKYKPPKYGRIKHKYKQPVKKSFSLVKDNLKGIIKNKHSILFDGYAGCGKTTLAINDIIPEMFRNEYNFIVTSMEHRALSEYRSVPELKGKVGTMEHYVRSYQDRAMLQDLDYIIIDEFSKIDNRMWNFIYLNKGINTSIIALGDVNQQLEYNAIRDKKHDYNKSLMDNCDILSMFDIVTRNKNNWRNGETTENYDNMYKHPKTYELNDIQNNMIDRMSKINICLTRAKVNEINEIFTRKWKEKIYSKDKKAFLKVKKGGRLITDFNLCKSNYNITKKLNDIGIYNNIFYIIMSWDKTHIKLLSEFNNIFRVPIELIFIDKCLFSYGYAITAFRCQGMTIKHKHMGVHELDMIRRYGRTFYTVFSRYKVKKSRSYLEIKSRAKLSPEFRVSLDDGFDDEYDNGFNEDVESVLSPIDANEKLINKYVEELKDFSILNTKSEERYLLATY